MSRVSPRRGLGASLLVCAAAALAYANGLRGAFLYDDLPYIVENPQVQEGGLKEAFTEPLSGRPELGLYRPLAVLTYQWQAQAQDGNALSPVPFHVLNVALHAAASVLVLFVATALGFSRGPAVLGALLFAVHPVHAEAVTWIVGRAELLAAVFALASTLVFLRTGGAAVAAALWFLACLGKEGALALPGVLLVLELRVPASRGPRALLRRFAPFLVVLGIVVAIRLRVLGHFGPEHSLGPYGGMGVAARLPVIANLLGSYFRMALAPWPSRIFYHSSEFLGFQWVPLAILGAAVLVLVLSWKRSRVSCCIGAFVLLLFPVLNVVPIQECFAERFLYLPTAFLMPVLAEALWWPVRREQLRRGQIGTSLAVPGAVVLVYLALTWYGNRHYRDADVLWHHTAAVAPAVPFPHYQLAYFAQQEGRLTPRDARDRGALLEYRTALELAGELEARGLRGMPVDQKTRALLNVGILYARELPAAQRDPSQAARFLREAAQLAQKYPALDQEWASALLHLALLRRFPESGVPRSEARSLLETALHLNVEEPLRRAVEEELAKLAEEEAAEAKEPPP